MISIRPLAPLVHVAPAAFALVAATAIAEPVTYEVEPNHSSVVFEAKHFNTSTVRARIPAKSGSITVDTAARTGKLNVVMDTGNVNSGIAKFDTHLKSADFFNAERFPEASFVATDFRFDGDKVTAVNGFLNLIGNSKPVTLTATSYNCYQSPAYKKQVCGGDFVTTIKRSEWNVNYGIPFVPDDVKLLVQIEAIKQ